jgi:Uma2 family endonuclease
MVRRPLHVRCGRRIIGCMPLAARKVATLDDLLAIPEDERRHEIIDGELVQQAMTSFVHGRALNRLGGRIGDPYDRPPGRRGPGGWWFATDVDIAFAPDQIYRPDIAGWRRDRVPSPPQDFPVRIRPDWVCEIVSPGNARNDKVKKFRTYHRCQVPHYWILDPMEEILHVYRWAEPGYITVVTVERGERIRAEPFEAVEIDLDELFGDKAGDEDPQEPSFKIIEGDEES